MSVKDAAKIFAGGVVACLACVLAAVFSKKHSSDAGGVRPDNSEHDDCSESADRIGQCAEDARGGIADAQNAIADTISLLREIEARAKE